MELEDEEIVALAGGLLMYKLISDYQWANLIESYKTITERHRWVKIQNFWEETAPQMVPRVFRRYFRMYRETLNSLANYIAPSPALENLRQPLGKCLAMTLAYVGSQSTVLHLAFLFDVSEETFLRSIDLVMKAFLDNIHQIICWPRRKEYKLIADQFNKVGGVFPNTIGAVDGTHFAIEITSEKANKEKYWNYKQYTSIQLQGIATYDLRFIDVFAGYPGSCNDYLVFRESPISARLRKLLRDNSRGIVDSFHILGDSAYPCLTNLMVPYKKVRLSYLNKTERLFNLNLSSKRQVIERAFGLLKKRFPRLLKLNQKHLTKKINLVLVCCILHNICIIEGDNISYFLQKAEKTKDKKSYASWPTPENERLESLKGKNKRLLKTLAMDKLLSK